MEKFRWITVFLILIFVNASILQADDPFKRLDQAWEDIEQATESHWEALEKEQKEKWARFQVEVEKKWQEFVHSTKKDWVEYSQDKDVRSKVDFKKGKVVLEAIVPEDEPEAMEKARRKIEEQAEKIFSQEDIARKKVLENQVANKKGDKVDPANLKNYLKEEVLPEVKQAPQPFLSRDGVKRRRYKVAIYLVPNHIRIRAEKYLPTVEENAVRFKLEPQLVLAVMHTESYFNPKAISSSNAVGIMQIIPKYAGRDAYQAIHGVDKIISMEYLFDPENNIEIGCAYLSLLKYNHFKDVQGDIKNRYLSICGYNWGPTSMRKKIVDKYPISQMSDGEVYSLLRQKTPEETRDYIKKVTERMPIYDPFFN